jgi:hypothetical protein
MTRFGLVMVGRRLAATRAIKSYSEAGGEGRIALLSGGRAVTTAESACYGYERLLIEGIDKLSASFAELLDGVREKSRAVRAQRVGPR